MLELIVTAMVLGQYPDAIDHLRAEDVVPQVGLLLDRSCSMRGGRLHTTCDWYADAHNGGNRSMHKSDQMKSALVGCESPNDGVLDRWASRINFSVYEFGSGTGLGVPFDSDLAALEDGVLRVPQRGGTHMSRALRDGGLYFNNYFDDANTEVCRPNFLVMLSDGNPNGGSSRFEWECTPPRESRWVSRNRPWEGADYLWTHEDLMCSVAGDQKISSYTVGFGAPGTFNPNNLQRIADEGGGEYFYAADVQSLNAAFESIIASLRARSAIFFAPLSIESGSLFPGNDAYVSSFRPLPSGRWRGTLKKYCVMPPILTGGRFDTSEKDCLFVSPDGDILETNPLAKDQWTGSQALAADSGGSGQLIVEALGGVGATPPSDPWVRNILTYRPGADAYVPVDPDHWTEADAFANGCSRLRVLARLHGYADVDCDTEEPTVVDEWALGDPVFANPVFLRYGDCDSGSGPIAGNCFVLLPANDGMLHFFDAATGEETAALIPHELWGPNRGAFSRLEEQDAQPSERFTHRFYLDGQAQLVHVDDDADFVIDSGEKAHVLFSLGRGGPTRYLLDVSQLQNGVPSAEDNPIYGLAPQPGTAFEEMQPMLAPAWVGRLRVGGKDPAPVAAVMPTGHVPELDFDRVGEGVRMPRPPEQPGTRVQGSCDGPDGLSDQSRLGAAGFCDAFHFPGCRAGSCYDALGVARDEASPPLTWTDGFHGTAAIRIHFDVFDLDPGDLLQIEDGVGNVVATYREDDLQDAWSAWVYDRRLLFRLVSDGVDRGHEGFRIDRVEVIRDHDARRLRPGDDEGQGPRPGFELGTDHRPEIWAVDLDRWNGKDGPVPLNATASDEALLLRVTSDCGGPSPAGMICIDGRSNPDLKDMICPVSTEVSAWMAGSEAVALYWGDECGQIWKAYSPDDGVTWKAKKLISLNDGEIGYGPDHRKLFTRLDLVQSRCPGPDVVGIYFGTGDLQRPSDMDLLDDPSLNDGHDLVGVLWDDGKLPEGLTQSDLADATNEDLIDPRKVYRDGQFGWAIRLREEERVLREPLVAEGVAFFKTFTPVPASEECANSSGVDRVYSMNNCSAEAARDVDGNGQLTKEDRESWSGNTEGGADLFVYTPKETGMVISHGDITRRQRAELNLRRRRPGIFLWREVR